MDPKDNAKTAGLSTQPATEGSGPLYHRRYTTQFKGKGLKARELMAEVKADPNRFSPRLMATFEKTRGHEVKLEQGDQFMVHITGPWNGPVEVSEVTEDSFTLKTLSGHMEAGRIRFAASDAEGGGLKFVIESWARSHTPIVDFLYDKIPLARAAQATMWVSFCKSIADFAKSETVESPKVDVLTQKWDGQTWITV